MVKFKGVQYEKEEVVVLNFIICDDEKEFRDLIKGEIDKFMMNYDVDYKKYECESYEEDFETLARKEMGFKVYFFDIKTKNGSGLDAARFIREELDDWNSIIIIVTAFAEYRYEALSNRLYLLDFISKFDNCKTKLKETLKIIYKQYNSREKCLTYEYNYTLYKIGLKNIIFIEKEQDSKRCIVHTTYGTFKAPFTLNAISKQLDKRFLKVHKSLILNTDKIRSYDIKENEILFDNGMSTNLISRSGKKELINYVTNNH